MKTRTNFRRAAVRSAAVIVSFILISFTVSAQGFWKKLLTNSSFNEIAIAMIETGNVENAVENTKTFDADWKRFDMAFDPALELEGWMSSEEHFRVNVLNNEGVLNAYSHAGNVLPDLNYSADTSEPLELEAWMVHAEVWIN